MSQFVTAHHSIVKALNLQAQNAPSLNEIKCVYLDGSLKTHRSYQSRLWYDPIHNISHPLWQNLLCLVLLLLLAVIFWCVDVSALAKVVERSFKWRDSQHLTDARSKTFTVGVQTQFKYNSLKSRLIWLNLSKLAVIWCKCQVHIINEFDVFNRFCSVVIQNKRPEATEACRFVSILYIFKLKRFCQFNISTQLLWNRKQW